MSWGLGWCWLYECHGAWVGWVHWAWDGGGGMMDVMWLGWG